MTSYQTTPFVILFLACSSCSPPAHPQAADASTINPRTDAEKKAAQFIRDNENDPGSVEFSRFGPDDEKGVIIGGQSKPGGSVIRVRCRAKNLQGAMELKDVLVFQPADGKTTELPNPWGDDWLKAMQSQPHEDVGR